ncbi:homeobox protein MSX-2 isoform X3 [Pelodiscus sinensis]
MSSRGLQPAPDRALDLEKDLEMHEVLVEQQKGARHVRLILVPRGGGSAQNQSQESNLRVILKDCSDWPGWVDSTSQRRKQQLSTQKKKQEEKKFLSGWSRRVPEQTSESHSLHAEEAQD